MDDLDPHLAILLRDFVRLCPENAPLEPDDWTGLYEMCVFIHEHSIPFAPSSFWEFLIQHGCSANKATAMSQQYSQCLHELKLTDDGPQASVPPLDETPTAKGAEGDFLNKGATDASIPI